MRVACSHVACSDVVCSHVECSHVVCSHVVCSHVGTCSTVSCMTDWQTASAASVEVVKASPTVLASRASMTRSPTPVTLTATPGLSHDVHWLHSCDTAVC